MKTHPYKTFSHLAICLVLLVVQNCAVIKNQPQKSKFMEVIGGGYFLNSGRQLEETYGLVVQFKNLPTNAKYLIADIELPNNPGVYDRKIFPVSKESSLSIKSDPIYGVSYGLYYIKLSLAEDDKGNNIIDHLDQSIKIYGTRNKGRDHAAQYTLLEGKKEIKKLLVVYPNNKKRQLITAEISNEFKIGHATVGFDESIVEYVPNKETVYNWTKIITLRENNIKRSHLNKPYIVAAAVGNLLYKKFAQTDKEIQVTYAGIVDGEFVNVETPNFQELIKGADEVGAYLDYADPLFAKNHPYQREYLAVRAIKSDISVWELQCTVRYDKRWSKKKIDALKKEAKGIVASFKYVESDPVQKLEQIAAENGIKNFVIKTQRLDDRDLNIKFKANQKSPYQAN